MFKIQSATVVRLEESNYYVTEIDGTTVTLTPVNPSYGNMGDVHMNVEYEGDQLTLVETGDVLTPEDWDETLD